MDVDDIFGIVTSVTEVRPGSSEPYAMRQKWIGTLCGRATLRRSHSLVFPSPTTIQTAEPVAQRVACKHHIFDRIGHEGTR